MLDVQETMNNEEMMEVAETISDEVNSSKLLKAGVGIVIGCCVATVAWRYALRPLKRKLQNKINEIREAKSEELEIVDVVPDRPEQNDEETE